MAKTLREQIAILQKENEELQAKLERDVSAVAPAEYEKLKAENERMKAENEGLEKDYSRISEKWRQSEAEKAELQKSFDDLQKTLKDSQSQGGEHIRRSALMFNAGMANFLEKFGGYVWLTEHLDEIPDQERKSFVSGINAIYAWACKMKELLEEEM